MLWGVSGRARKTDRRRERLGGSMGIANMEPRRWIWKPGERWNFGKRDGRKGYGRRLL